MSKQPVGGERPSRARATNTAPARPPARHLSASAQRDGQAVPGAPRDGGAGTSAAMAARPAKRFPHENVTIREAGITEVRASHPGEGSVPHRPGQPPGHGGAEGAAPAMLPRGNPYYVPPSQRRREQPRQAVDQQPYPYGGAPDERRTMPGLVGAPPSGPRPHGGGFTTRSTTNIVERVSTIKQDDGVGHPAGPAPEAPGESPPRYREQAHTPPPLGRSRPQHHGQGPPMSTPTRLPGKSPSIRPPERKKIRRPAAFCFTACCILFWLLVIAVGVAVLVVYLLYRPQPPRLRVTSATLNAGYIDELGRRGLALNSDLTVLAAISSPNTKIDIVLHYMQLDLYFEGNLIGTQVVWPAPLHEGPGGSVLRSVHIVVSEVTMPREDVMVWQNATAKGGPVVLKLAGRFHTQLNFGRWLPYRYWVYPRCTLWLDPPPSGALRRVRC